MGSNPTSDDTLVLIRVLELLLAESNTVHLGLLVSAFDLTFTSVSNE